MTGLAGPRGLTVLVSSGSPTRVPWDLYAGGGGTFQDTTTCSARS